LIDIAEPIEPEPGNAGVGIEKRTGISPLPICYYSMILKPLKPVPLSLFILFAGC
jgi:hypothetical protein